MVIASNPDLGGSHSHFRNGFTAVDNALMNGSFMVIQALRDFNAAIDDRLVRGTRALHILTGFELIQAAAVGDGQEVEKLLDSGVDCNVRDYDCRTSLHLAVANDHDHVAMLLFNRGANPFAQDRWGVTPIGEALRNNDTEFALRLGYKESGVLQNNSHNNSNITPKPTTVLSQKLAQIQLEA